MFSVRRASLQLRQCSKYLSPLLASRSIQQAVRMSTISEAIIKDHRELKEYYNEVVNNPGNHDHQDRYGNQFTWELARHSVGEELVVYPAFEKYLGEKGKAMAEEDRKEHAVVGFNPTTHVHHQDDLLMTPNSGQRVTQNLSEHEGF